MTIYMVTKGEYSAYYVVGLFSTKEQADGFIDGARQDRYSHCQVEEVKVDELADSIFRATWRARIVLSTGEFLDPPSDVCDGSEVAGKGERGKTYLCSVGPPVAVAVSYVSDAHARKLAVEARQRWLHNGFLPKCETIRDEAA